MELPSLRRPSDAGSEAKEKVRPPGRPLWAYLLPVLLAALAGLALLVFFALQYMQSTRGEADRAAGRVAAEALATRVGEYLRGRRALLEVVERSAAARKALKQGDHATLEATAGALAKLLPGVIRLRLVPPGPVRPDPEGEAPMGFAGVDMVRRALQGRRTGAEIHQITAGRPYLALARPVMEGNRVLGAAFAAWPMKPLRALAATAPEFPGSLWLMQGGTDGYVISARGEGRPPAGTPGVAVPGSIWSVYYQVRSPGLDAGAMTLLAIAGAALLVIAGVLFLRLRTLAADLRADMASLAALGEAIAEGHGAGEHVPLTAAARPAMLLLCQLARKHFRNGKKGAPKLEVKQPEAGEETPPAAPGIQVEESDQRPPVKAPAEIFRAYDIRGLAGEELDAEVAAGLGWAFGELARDNGVEEVFVAHDPRLSSPELYEALCQGLAEMGLRVVELGMAPAGVLYYAMHKAPDAAAVLVTGSHNPPEYNGFKLYLRTEPVQGEQLQALQARMLKGGFQPRPGSRETRDLRRDYLDAVAQEVTLGRALTVVVDGGNGAAGETACALFELLGCEVVPLFCEPDGHFPNHHPDPSRPENLEALKAEVLARHADVGVAFDGDGDRVALVDDRGEAVWPEHLLMLLAADILRRHPGSDVIYDVKSSRHLAGFILSQGGRPIMWRSGHTRMKEKMRETGALIGGEFSGHIYIKERWFGSDDGIYVAARLLEVLADDPRPAHEQIAELPHSPATPEYQLPLNEGEALLAMQAIMAAASFPEARVVDLDGLRIEFSDSWGLVRPSNTLPALTFRFEADSEIALEEVKQRFRELLRLALPDHAPPF